MRRFELEDEFKARQIARVLRRYRRERWSGVCWRRDRKTEELRSSRKPGGDVVQERWPLFSCGGNHAVYPVVFDGNVHITIRCMRHMHSFPVRNREGMIAARASARR